MAVIVRSPDSVPLIKSESLDHLHFQPNVIRDRVQRIKHLNTTEHLQWMLSIRGNGRINLNEVGVVNLDPGFA